ncbi:MAG: hypothetical protein JNM66_26920 [Bryobacterales bacterium]|nr:hypothetical protein [Bryobacterales bacterium]
MTQSARNYVAAVVTPGVAILLWAALNWTCPDPASFALYLALTIALSVVRFRLPGLVGTYSLSFLPVLYGLNHFTASEVLIASAAGAAAGTFCKPSKGLVWSQFLFNTANLTLSSAACLFSFSLLQEKIQYLPALLSLMVTLFFTVNTLLVSGILSLVQKKSFHSVIEAWYLWSFIYYLGGAVILGLAMAATQSIHAWIFLLPLVLLISFFWRIRKNPVQLEKSNAGQSLPRRAELFIHLTVLAAGALTVLGLFRWSTDDSNRFLAFAVMAALASGFKLRLPNMVGTISTNFVVILFAASELQWVETMVIASIAAVVQSYWRAKSRPKPIQVVFNVSAVVLSSTAANLTAHAVAASLPGQASLLLSLLAGTTVYYACNSTLVCFVLGLLERQSFLTIWSNCRFWSLPYFLVGTSAAGLMVLISRNGGYQQSFLVLTLMAMVFFAYRAHLHAATIPLRPLNLTAE